MAQKSQNKLSTNEFKTLIRNAVAALCRERKWNYDNESHRGWAFQLWIAQLLCERDRGIDTEPDEAVLTTRDGGLDIILGDPNEKVWYFVQTKYVKLTKTPPIARSEVTDFFQIHELLSDPSRFKKHFSENVRDRIGNHGDFLKEGYRIHYYFITTGTDVEEKSLDIASAYSSKREDVSFHVLDFHRLKEFYLETQRLEESIPERVQLSLGRGRWILIDSPRKTLLCIVKANELINLYKAEGDALFAHNIRTFLGRKSLNKDIIRTASEQPDNFFYYNNGISAICTKLLLDAADEAPVVVAEKFQVINGAQTVGALAKSDTTPGCRVLLRITEGESVATEKGFNASIIRYNNTQNVVKASDFRSNDPIQLWLERRFREVRSTGAISKMEYRRKRSGKKAGAGVVVVTLEELARIRYSWLCEPTRCVGDPRSLWTLGEDGGFYEQAFGVDGIMQEVGSEDTFMETVAAVVIYKRIEAAVEEIRKGDRKFIFLRRLRFFALGLASMYLSKKNIDAGALVAGEERRFREAFATFWKEALRELNSVHYDFVVENEGTLFALTRSESKWRSLSTKFGDYLEMREMA